MHGSYEGKLDTFDVLGTYVLVPVRVPDIEDIKYQRFYIKEMTILMLGEEGASSYTYNEACKHYYNKLENA